MAVYAAIAIAVLISCFVEVVMEHFAIMRMFDNTAAELGYEAHHGQFVDQDGNKAWDFMYAMLDEGVHVQMPQRMYHGRVLHFVVRPDYKHYRNS